MYACMPALDVCNHLQAAFAALQQTMPVLGAVRNDFVTSLSLDC